MTVDFLKKELINPSHMVSLKSKINGTHNKYIVVFRRHQKVGK